MNLKKINIEKFSMVIALNYIIYILFAFLKIILLPLIIVSMFKDQKNVILTLLGNLSLIGYYYIKITSIVFMVLGIVFLLKDFINKRFSMFLVSLSCIGLFIIRIIIFTI